MLLMWQHQVYTLEQVLDKISSDIIGVFQTLSVIGPVKLTDHWCLPLWFTDASPKLYPTLHLPLSILTIIVHTIIHNHCCFMCGQSLSKLAPGIIIKIVQSVSIFCCQQFRRSVKNLADKQHICKH